MIKIALTGNKGSGKSFVLDEFCKLGVPIFKLNNYENIEIELEEFYKKNLSYKYVIIECALLFEYKLELYFDNILFLYSDYDLIKKESIKNGEFLIDNYKKSHISDEYKTIKSDFVLVNDFTDKIIDDIHRFNQYLMSN